MRRALPLVVLLSACGGTRPVTCTGACAGPHPSSTAPTALTPPPPAARWSLPACPLRYELLTTETFDTPPGPPMGLVTFALLDETAAGGRLEVRVTPTFALEQGKYRPFVRPDRGFAPFELTTDGRSWREEGVARPMLALGSQGGLAWLFPPVPDPIAHSWSLPLAEASLNRNGIAAFDSRSEAFSLGRTVPFPLDQTLEVRADGTTVLRAHGPERWSSRSSPGADDFAVLERDGDLRTEHVLLPSGRLLRAHLERDVALTFTVKGAPAGGANPIRSRITQRSDAHLVSACDGPTAPSLAPHLSREERAIDAVGELGMAVLEPSSGQTPQAWLSSGLRKARGDRAIAATIARYRKAHGGDAWPLPVLVRDEDIVTLPDRVVVAATTSVRSPSTADTTTPVKFRFDVIEEDGRPVVNRIVGAYELEPGQRELLVIAHDRLAP